MHFDLHIFNIRVEQFLTKQEFVSVHIGVADFDSNCENQEKPLYLQGPLEEAPLTFAEKNNESFDDCSSSESNEEEVKMGLQDEIWFETNKVMLDSNGTADF